MNPEFYSIALCAYPMPAPHSLDYYNFMEGFKLESMSPPILFFFEILMTILGPLNFCMIFSISLPISAQKSGGILIGVTLNL